MPQLCFVSALWLVLPIAGDIVTVIFLPLGWGGGTWISMAATMASNPISIFFLRMGWPYIDHARLQNSLQHSNFIELHVQLALASGPVHLYTPPPFPTSPFFSIPLIRSSDCFLSPAGIILGFRLVCSGHRIAEPGSVGMCLAPWFPGEAQRHASKPAKECCNS